MATDERIMRGANPSRRAAGAGFTLIEMIMVIVIMGIIAAVLSRFIAKPVQGYLDSSRRAALVDAADTALNRMTREIRLALPNSIRVSGGNAIEFLRVRAGGRYRAEGAGNPLDLNAAAGTFDVLGAFDSGEVAPGSFSTGCGASGNGGCVVIYNTGQFGADAYAEDDVADITAAGATSISFTRATPFPLASASQRFFVIDGPVRFVCDTGTGEVRRYAGYGINAAMAAPLVGGNSALLVDKVSACTFSYAPGTATRGGLATLEIRLTDQGESIGLVQQIHVSNVP